MGNDLINMKTQQALRTPYYREISGRIVDSIRAQRLLPHQKLPSNAELCKQFGVSKITIEKALKLLAQEHLIYRIPGRGSFVAEIDSFEHIKAQRKGFIAFICPSLRSHHVANILTSVEEYAFAQGFRTALCLSRGSFEKQEKIIRSLLEEEVDGMIIYPTEGEYYDEAILSMTVSRFPFVLVDKKFDKIKASYVISDHSTGSYEGTKVLLQKGHTHIAFISTYSPEGTSTIRDRLAGYLRAMEEAGIPLSTIQHLILAGFFEQFDHPLSYNEDSRQIITEKIKDFLWERPEITAILSMSPGNFSYVAHALKQIDPLRALQTEFAIFDVDEDLDYSKTPLLIISQNSREMGKIAVNTLMKLMQNPQEVQSFNLPMIVKYI